MFTYHKGDAGVLKMIKFNINLSCCSLPAMLQMFLTGFKAENTVIPLSVII